MESFTLMLGGGEVCRYLRSELAYVRGSLARCLSRGIFETQKIATFVFLSAASHWVLTSPLPCEPPPCLCPAGAASIGVWFPKLNVLLLGALRSQRGTRPSKWRFLRPYLKKRIKLQPLRIIQERNKNSNRRKTCVRPTILRYRPAVPGTHQCGNSVFGPLG